MPAYDDDLGLAHELADTADAITMARFGARPGGRDQARPDAGERRRHARRAGHPATLSRARPRDAVLGEEDGETGHGPRRWVVDPVDGTKNFVRGVPVWATLIALKDGGEVVAGVVSAPALAGAGGRRGLRRVDRQAPVVGHPAAGVRGDRSPTRRCRTPA